MMDFFKHQQMIDRVAKQTVGGPNELLKFLFSEPGFLTDYQKDAIRAWMQDPTITPQQATAQAGSQAQPSQPSGPAAGGQPAGAVSPAAAPNPVGQVKPA